MDYQHGFIYLLGFTSGWVVSNLVELLKMRIAPNAKGKSKKS